jgi:hypothetical protein
MEVGGVMKKPEGFTGNQVVTELDFWNAMCDYIVLQLQGRFQLEYPNYTEYSDEISKTLNDEWTRTTVENMQNVIRVIISKFGMTLTECSLDGCQNHENHALKRDFINLIWDIRQLTDEWLRSEGIVPGHSIN